MDTPPPISPERLSRAVARRYHVRGHTAADLRHEAYVSMLESVASGECSPRALIRAARRRLQQLYRRSLRDGLTLQTTPLDREPRAEALAQSAEQFDALLRLVTCRQAIVLEMTYRQGLGDDAIAAALGTSIGAVQVARSKALAQLRRGVDDGG